MPSTVETDVAGGHFFPEEDPQPTTATLRRFFAGSGMELA